MGVLAPDDIGTRARAIRLARWRAETVSMSSVDEPGTFAKVLTPLGHGGISVIAVWGADAARLLDSLFVNPQGRRISDAAPGALLYGTLRRDGEILDEAVVCRRIEPEIFEVNCHGGIVPLTRVMAALRKLGIAEARPSRARGGPGSVARGDPETPKGRDDSFLVAGWRFETDDEIRREAAAALAGALTPVAAKMLLDQLDGALSRKLGALVEMLKKGEVAATTEELRSLVRAASLGIGLCAPMRVVVAGKSNVGKSTLVNRLAAQEVSIVHHRPGTTRDSVEHCVAIAGYPFILIDTAGIVESPALRARRAPGRALRDPGHGGRAERAPDALELVSSERSTIEIEKSDILLLVFDHSAPLTAEDEHLLLRVRHRRIVGVLNKSDLPAPTPSPTESSRPVLEPSPGKPGEKLGSEPCSEAKRILQGEPVAISALTGDGMERLETAVLDEAFPIRWKRGAPVPFTHRQKRLLELALESLEAARNSVRPPHESIVAQPPSAVINSCTGGGTCATYAAARLCECLRGAPAAGAPAGGATESAR